MMKQSALAAALALLLLVVAAAAADMVPPSKYTNQENVASDFIREVGTFAVTVYKLAHRVMNMYYVSTSQCWSTPAGGGASEYWMVLTATNGTGGASGRYAATVWGIPGSESRTWKLLSFSSAY